MTEEFIQAWLKLFATTPVSVRTVIEHTQRNQDLLRVVLAAVPKFAVNPHPRTLTDWLARHENLPCAGYRLVRAGHRWRLAEPLKLAVAA